MCHGWLLFGLQTQHAAGSDPDIDLIQWLYFHDELVNHAKLGKQNLIIFTHAPFWLLQGRPGQRLSSLLDVILELGNITLHAIIAGDIHHYSRYVPKRKGGLNPQLIVSGGGGALLHSTFTLKTEINVTWQLQSGVMVTPYKLASNYPSKNQSLSVLQKLWFQNWKFGLFLLAIIFFLHLTFRAITHSPASVCFFLWVIFLFAYWYFDLSKFIIAAPLEVLQIVLLCLVIQSLWLLITQKIFGKVGEETPFSSRLRSLPETLEFGVGVLLPALPILLLLTMHLPVLTTLLHKANLLDDFLFSGLGVADYKNFLRIHLTNNTGNIHVIGIPSVTGHDEILFIPDEEYFGLFHAISRQEIWTELVDLVRIG